MPQRRPGLKGAIRAMILERDNHRCVYCGYHAQVIDHVVPYCIVREHSFNNLVSACTYCNTIASGRDFRNLKDKYQYIKSIRTQDTYWKAEYAKRKDDIAYCADCGEAYKQRFNGSTILLCAECAIKCS